MEKQLIKSLFISSNLTETNERLEWKFLSTFTSNSATTGLNIQLPTDAEEYCFVGYHQCTVPKVALSGTSLPVSGGYYMGTSSSGAIIVFVKLVEGVPTITGSDVWLNGSRLSNRTISIYYR